MSLSIVKKNIVESDENFNLDYQGKVLIRNPEKIQKLNRVLTSNRCLSLIIMPTENCNFRCTYCYEDFSIGRMKLETINGIKSLIEKRCSELDYINIGWFGGEPLMAKDIVLDISRFVMSMVYSHPNLRYDGSITTNAYLLDHELALALSSVGVSEYQISLDGPREIHNKSRLRADGANTFDKIWSNLLAIRDSSLPVKIILRIHVAVDTYSLLDPLLEDIKHEFLHDSRFSIFFKAIERLGSSNDGDIKQFSQSEHDIVMNSLKQKLFGEDCNLPQNAELPDNYICYASRPNSLIVRANGDIGKCTVALYDKRNKIGTLKSDGTMEVIPGRLAPWVRGLETLDPVTLACPLTALPFEDNKI
jgi:uncharacterized protein